MVALAAKGSASKISYTIRRQGSLAVHYCKIPVQRRETLLGL